MSEYGHAGMILFMTDALQDYLSMEGTLKQLPDFMRLTDQEKARFDGMFKAVKGVRKDFANRYLKEVVNEVIAAHKDDTDSQTAEDVKILKSFKL